MAERLNMTIRYDQLYLEEYSSLAQVATGFGDWVQRCSNARRRHSAFGYLAPEVLDQQWHTRHQEPSRGLA